MSLVKKPRRNIRARGFTESEEAESEQTEECHTLIRDTKPKKAGKHAHQPLLSFEEDLNEGDDGEVFKVKKSAQSKKIKKQLDKERKRKKEKPDINADPNSEKNLIPNALDDDIVIKLKNTFPILNGKEAEAAVQEGMSSDEEEDKSVHKFTKRPDAVKLILERGKIPDAATIHAARKQRQHVREMGEIVPVPDESSRFENAQSRLIREDDNDVSDGEEERINMAVNLAAEDRIRRKAEFEAAQELGSEESDKGEEEEWETQQIRKGVTGAQIAAVQQETLFYNQYLGSGGSTGMLGERDIDSRAEFGSSAFPPLPPSGITDPQVVVSKLKDRLTDLREVHRRHTIDRDKATDEINTLKRECAELKENAPKLAERFRFYQDLRGYVTDLVECLDEKIMIVEMLEQRVESLFSTRNADYVNRRRHDVMDQSQEHIPLAQRGKIEKDEAQVRRIAEREGRRIRRQRARELKGIVTHVDGMSSDEEITETEIVTARAQREVIEKDAKQVFEDTLEEFSSIQGVLERFEQWRKNDMDAYIEAYVSFCLPKLLGPLIRLKLLFWNPFTPGNNDIEKTQWCNSLLLYGLDPEETEESLKKDPDIQLLPRIVEKIVLPKLTQLTSLCWDPMSSSQTVSFVSLVTKLIQDYPTITHSSKFLTNLVSVIIEKMKEAVEKDIFIPIYPKQKLLESKVFSFFSRQCTVAVKLLGNIVRWQGILSDTALSEIALNSLLNRYLLSAMRICQPIQAANLCQMIGNILPRVWLQVCVHPPQLLPFLNEAHAIARQLDIDKPIERDAMERMSGVLKAAALLKNNN
ncbi:PAX3- and PAX7-binding protein 1 [Cimex lectularius]|uniref:GCF C-terminal domain-containing protein n=1 Tax=Cimex lectularius TaxID=79782 RepID=A0A8I6R6I8_CIMLE|nr:PAX3- and PAX7-binding protein 1 [Cimex lectularius]XP_014239887.1 PAX3- and PAX7-binding protein 1 [Cimex lectularius]